MNKFFKSLGMISCAQLGGRGIHLLPSKRKLSLNRLFAPEMDHKGRGTCVRLHILPILLSKTFSYV